MNDSKTFLGTEPIGKLLRRLSIPTLAAQIINMLYNLVDRVYIGHIPNGGDLALTGVGVCLPLIMIVSAFAALVASGGAPKAAIEMGKNDHDKAEKILGTCAAAQIIISLILTIALLIWHRDLLLIFGASPETIDYASSYMQIYAIGTICVQLTLSLNAFITTQGYTKTAMYSVLIGAITNIVLDPLFIFGMNLGVKGAAIATVISQGISTIWIILFLTGGKSALRIKPENLKIVPKLLFPCLALGLATFVMQASESVIIVCFNSSLLNYGGDIAVGAMTILTSVMQFALLPLMGVGQGAQPIMSYNYGAKKIDRVKKTFKLLLKCDLIYSTVLWAAVMLFPRVFASLFTNEANLIAFTIPALRVYCAVLCIFGIQMACQMAFVSIGSAASSIAVAVVRKFVLLLPLIYLTPVIFPSDPTFAVYLAEPIADFLAVSFTAILFALKFNKSLKKMAETPSAKEKTT